MPLQVNIQEQKDVPPEIRGWNWGAFFLTWIWGINNGTLIALLSLIPGIHFIMMFVLGAKGNEWAWCNKNWQSVEQFQKTQRKWASWGLSLWLFVFGLLIVIPTVLLGWGVKTEMPEIKAMMQDFDPHRKYCNYALAMAERDPRSASLLGRPLALSGRAEAVTDRYGHTEVAVPVRGPRGEATLFVRTQREANAEAQLERAELELKGLERMKLDTRGAQQKMEAVEEKISKLVAAVRAGKTWQKREPGGREEAEEFYRESLKQIENEPAVREVFGERIEAQVENANVNLEGPMGNAEFHVVLRANGKTGLLNLKGTRSMGRWSFAGAQLELQGRMLQFPARQILGTLPDKERFANPNCLDASVRRFRSSTRDKGGSAC